MPNEQNMKGNGMRLKTVSFTAYAVKVKFPPKICFLNRTLWGQFKEAVKPNGLS